MNAEDLDRQQGYVQQIVRKGEPVALGAVEDVHGKGARQKLRPGAGGGGALRPVGPLAVRGCAIGARRCFHGLAGARTPA
jgi:hypothetical protein